MRTLLAGLLAVPGIAIAACGSGERTDPPVDAPPGPLVVNGSVTGPQTAAGPVVVLWGVNAPQSDYAYKLGEGTATATAFTTMPLRELPAEARNRGPSEDLGVGVLLLLDPGASLPDGMVASPAPAFVGASFRHAIIYRGPGDTGAVRSWTSAFPIGLSCGRCAATSTGFDQFVPVDCAMVAIDTDPAGEFCNWM